jgi:hypothetical protein
VTDSLYDDDRPRICPACGVTMGITVDADDRSRDVCLECGFALEEGAVSTPGVRDDDGRGSARSP